MERTGSRSPTVLAGIVSALMRSASADGLERTIIEARTGLGLDSISEVDARIPLRAYQALWSLISSSIGDLAFGLRAGAERTASTLGVLGYLAMSSQNLGEALDHASRMFKLVNESGSLVVERGLGRVMITRTFERPPCAMREDAFLATMLTLAQRWTKQRIFPIEVRLSERIGIDLSAHREFFRCRVLAGRGQTQMAFTKEHLGLGLVRADAQLSHHLQEIAEHQFRQLRYENELVKQLQSFLEGLSEESDRSIDAAAKHLGSSRRTLQRRLEENGIVYRDIVDLARKRRALDILQSNISVKDAAIALGYADVSSFRRAVRRWTGVSPSAFKRQGSLPR